MRFAVGIALAAVLALACASVSEAYVVDPLVEQNVPQISEQVARGGAPTYLSDMPCGTSCTSWWSAEQSPPANAAAKSRLSRAFMGLRARVGVAPAASALGRMSLVGTAGWIGWKIGQGIRAKYLRIPRPMAPSGLQNPEGVPIDKGEAILGSGCCGMIYAPDSGYALSWAAGDAGVGSRIYDTPPEIGEPCPQPGTPAVDGWTSLDSGAGQLCWIGLTGHYRAFFKPFGADEDSPLSPVEDYTDQPFEQETTFWSGQPTTNDMLENRVRIALESGDFPRTEAFFANKIDPRTHDDATKDDDSCELGTGAAGEDFGLDRGSGETGEDFVRRYEPMPSGVFPAEGVLTGQGRAFLRWGFTSPDLDNDDIAWTGWGYRHIKAKHGWSTEDRDATIEALTSGVATPNPRGEDRNRWDYLGPEYAGRNRTRCARFVAVEYALSTNDILLGAPEPAGIITSFGKVIG